MTPNLQALLERLEGLAGRATPAPWKVADHAPNDSWRKFHKIVCFDAPDGGGVRICDTTESYTGAHDGPGIDAQLIVALRNALPTLLSALKGREVPEEVLRVAEKWTDDNHHPQESYHDCYCGRCIVSRFILMLSANPADEGGKG